MKTLLLNVDYTNGTGVNGKGEFWAESYVKKSLVEQEEGETIHDTVKRIIEEEDHVEFSYKGKPQASIWREPEGNIVGYVYRVKHFISDRSNSFEGYAYFDAWVIIEQYNKEKIELKDIEV